MAVAAGRDLTSLPDNTLLGNPGRCERLARLERATARQRYTPERRAAALAGVYASVADNYDRGSVTTAPAFIP